ncbi:MAG TPA: ABC transporter permease [Chloroflexia bacterium]|nr:ABC transporter permease [Chloroflexia bacterium]
MDTLQKALEYALNPRNGLVDKLWAHVLLSGAALLLAVVIGMSLGIWISRFGALARLTVNFAGVLRVVPSIAVLFLLLPIVGTGFRPSLIALTFLAVPPILINTDAGMRSVSAAIIEAGRGLGMSRWRLLWRVQLPLAMPVVLAGLRRAAVEVIASATLATLIGGGGLGDYIQAGLALSRNDILLVGAVPVALLALVTELGLNYAERTLTRFGN